MKKVLFAISLIFLSYFVLIGMFFMANEDFTYSEIDIDSNGILTFSELDRYGNYKSICLCQGKEVHKKDDIYGCEKLEVKFFALKDGLDLKFTEKKSNNLNIEKYCRSNKKSKE